MDDVASFLRVCHERELNGYPPIDPRQIGLRVGDTDEVRAEVAADHASPTPEPKSAIFTVRITHEDHALLEQRAAAIGMSPSAMARNLIRMGLRAGGTTSALSAAVTRVEAATAELRAALP